MSSVDDDVRCPGDIAASLTSKGTSVFSRALRTILCSRLGLRSRCKCLDRGPFMWNTLPWCARMRIGACRRPIRETAAGIASAPQSHSHVELLNLALKADDSQLMLNRSGNPDRGIVTLYHVLKRTRDPHPAILLVRCEKSFLQAPEIKSDLLKDEGERIFWSSHDVPMRSMITFPNFSIWSPRTGHHRLSLDYKSHAVRVKPRVGSRPAG